MTKEAILAEIRKLGLEEQREIADALREKTDEQPELTDEQQVELQRRYAEYKKDPGIGSDWKDARARAERSLSC